MNNDSQLHALIKNMASEHRPDLPSPGLIWWRAQVQKKLAEKERIERPMMIMRMVVAAAALVIAVGLMVATRGQFTAGGHTGTLVVLSVITVAGFLVLPLLLRTSTNTR
ncbi:MAG TPA: hypothetical protein VE783_09490 [Candidatus Limnocylindrales bacterium]|jgi:hypothetical protein|nr:hypothetical protein [Candidatus Limnocylindrales bacterium]